MREVEWRLRRRFDLDPAVRSDLARRVFGLFLTDWQVHGDDGGPVVICVSDYARSLCGGTEAHQRVAVVRAFRRLVAVGWLSEGLRVRQQRAFALGRKARAAERRVA